MMLAFTLTLFGMIVTAVVDTFRNAFDPTATRTPRVVWNLLALGVGVALALIWQLNAFIGVFPHTSNVQGVAGQVLTGLSGTGASKLWHEVWDLLSSKAKQARPRASRPPTG